MDAANLVSSTQDMGIVPHARGAGSQSAPRGRVAPTGLKKLRVDGKYFALGERRVRIRGVTYGPFVPDECGEPFPPSGRVDDDLAGLRAAGINAVRTYHLPPEWFLRRADERGIGVFVDVPWPKHVCFLDSEDAQRAARHAVREAAERGRAHASVLAYSIGNEIPAAVVRWHGAARVERFLRELLDVAKQADPDGLVTYANFPPTEYLDLSFLDFATINVYLHDRDAFRRYLFRLQNIVGDKPLVLGELGMDTLRHGEAEQADFLAGHVREAVLMGLAGAFVFAWTDDWHTGGHSIEDWAFGITHADRAPKASYHALREVFEATPTDLLADTPRVSVVVCSFNCGRTLDQCLQSLSALDYPDYEVIVVDDGSTDDTRAILSRFPDVRAIHQPNQGLSAARNVGLAAATGQIIAYTDSDCFADAHWLTHLVYQFLRSGAAAVGGPNLTPEDGRRAACVAAAPGQPTHVLESDQVAEHIPGCNMAFLRSVLLDIRGFDPIYRTAGDDVDVCWRLQQAGHWITFAPGAFVWHHRRQTARAYLRQQAGYGEAEALLRFKHPDRFNGWGDGKWRGVLYGHSLRGLRLAADIVYRGTFCTGPFQTLYQPSPAHWAMLPATLEWHVIAILAGLVGFGWPTVWVAVPVMLALAVVVAALQAAQARLPKEHDGIGSRLLVAWLCYSQPLVRSWWRYRTRLFAYRAPVGEQPAGRGLARRLPLTGTYTAAYWSEGGCDRMQLLGSVLLHLNEHRWGKAVDSGWSDWDLEVYCHPWTVVQLCTAEEDHGGGKRLVRVRFRMRPSGYLHFLGVAAVLCGVDVFWFQSWWLVGAAALLVASCAALWYRGACRAVRILTLVDNWARQLNLLRCPAVSRPDGGPPFAERRGRLSRLLRWLDRGARRDRDVVEPNGPVP
jgi:GT2 family glycosyltransferase